MNQFFSAAGLALVMAFGAGCSTPDDKCEGDECPPVGGLCENKQCPAGTGCNEANGNCMNLCSLPGAPTCTAPSVCQPETGTCGDLCAGVTCPSNTLACNPQNGVCEQKCKPTSCPATSSCEPTTGECTPFCESETKPAGKAECAEGLKCKETTGACVPVCEGVVCGYGEYCVADEDGKADCISPPPTNGAVGSACTADSDCEGEGAKCDDVDFLTEEPIDGGVCTASCNTTECPAGSTCLGLGAGSTICLDNCVNDDSCREGFSCMPSLILTQGSITGDAYCMPTIKCDDETGVNCSPLGGDCETDGDCIDGAMCNPERGQNGQFTGAEGGECIIYTTSKGECPENGLLFSEFSDADGVVAMCFPTCSFIAEDGENLEYNTGCNLGEACVPFDNTYTNFICYESDCTVHSDCTDPAYPSCDPVLRLCFSSCVGKAADFCSAGTTCNETTGACELGCEADADCGTNAICGTGGVCEPRCSVNTEDKICAEGESCNVETGRCWVAPEPECDADADCAAGEICSEGECVLAPEEPA